MQKLILSGFFALLLQAGFPQRSIVFSRMGTAEGLNTDKIKGVTQDKKGFIWVGHENGVQRYDGTKFINFFHIDDDEQIAPAAVDEIAQANDHQIWIRQGTRVGMVNVHNYSFKLVPVDEPKSVQRRTSFSFYIQNSKNAYLLSPGVGILKYDPAANVFSTRYTDIHAPESWNATSLAVSEATGDCFIAGDSGLAIYNKKRKTLEYTGHSTRNLAIFKQPGLQYIRHVLLDKDNKLWIAYWKMKPEVGLSVMRYDPAADKILMDTALNVNAVNKYRDIYKIIETAAGHVWFCGINTLLAFDKGKNQLEEVMIPGWGDISIKARVMYDVFEDREKNIWVSTDNGLYMSGPEKSGVYNIFFSDQADKDILVESILETKNKENWIGTWDQGIGFFDKEFRKLPQKTPVTGNPDIDKFIKKVWTMHQHAVTRDVWVACQAAYIMVLNAQTKKINQIITPRIFDDNTINNIVEDKTGNLWFTTLAGQLVHWNYQAKIAEKDFIQLQKFPSAIQRMLIDRQERMWIATALNGIYVLDKSGSRVLEHYTSEDRPANRLINDRVLDIIQYNDSIFLAAAGGLNVINTKNKTITHKTIYDGIPGAAVYQLAVDAKQTLWMVTNNGLASYQLDNGIITSYDRKDGIMNANKARYCKETMSNGELWFGGENCLFGFAPEELKFLAKPPKVLITDFRLFNNFIPADSLLALDAIRLNHDENSFSIYFSALNFSQQDKLTYYFQMQGIDKEWRQADRGKAAYFTSLPPGNYTFKVKCENMQGESSAITVLNVYIKPPFYRTWWFLSLCIILVVLLIYFLYQQRISKLLAVEKLRSKVARDLHDDMGSTLSTINILSSMAKSRMNSNSVQASEYLSKISENSQRMMEAMDDIVWSIKPDNDSMQKITGRMREFATSVLEAKDIELDFRVDEKVKDLKLNMEARRDFFLIFKEAVNNVAKYSKCSFVEINIGIHQQRLMLTIKDNGIGFDVVSADSGNGLGNMHKRAESLKARLQIQSSPGNGTRINLNMPVQ